MADLGENTLSGVRVAGELEARQQLILERLTSPGFPEYTPEFVLADVRLDPDYPRLYDSFSGDISGRYIEALALSPTKDTARLADLVRELLRHQREDGRFGDPSVSFTAAEIGKPHMALLWGNGRLLVGLLTYHAAHGGAEVLASARRLGDFLLQVRQDCAAVEVAARLEGLGAHGLICFTQLIEGLVLLGQATGDERYFDAAREIAPSLPPRGIQHTHGYLSTLRGIVMLHDATGDHTLLEAAEGKFQELLQSPDYVVYGGVLEFFGAETHGISQEDLVKLHALDNKPPQDEGCSEADFVRLALQLWRATGKSEHLERAERCLLNHFFFNQFHSGDFGHRVLSHRGFRPSDNPGKAWWCCNMHGLRTFPDVASAIIAADEEGIRINLFLDCTYSDSHLELTMRQSPDWDGVAITIHRDADRALPLAIRKPSWAVDTQVLVNGERVDGTDGSDHISVNRWWRQGDELRVKFVYREFVQLRSGEQLELQDLGPEPVEAALFCGPWLLGVHEVEEPAFLERPWTWGGVNENVVDLPASLAKARVDTPAPGALPHPPVAVRLPYRHGGWPSRSEVTLRPICCQTGCAHQQVLAVWLTFRAA